MVQVEAMLCGTPVVATDLPGVRVPVRKTGMGELVRKEDARDLAEKIVMVVQKKAFYGKKQSIIVREVFSSEKVLVQYKYLIREKIEKK